MSEIRVGELLDTVLVVGKDSGAVGNSLKGVGVDVEWVPVVGELGVFANSMRGKDYELIIFTDGQVPLDGIQYINRWAKTLHVRYFRSIKEIINYIFDRSIDHIREASLTHDYKCNFLSYNVKQSDQSLLDVSCGRGVYLRYWRDKGLRVSATELDDRNCEYVQRHGINCHKIDLNRGNLRLPWVDNGVDIVTCTEVIEHLRDPKQVVAEMMRVSRRLVLITTPVGHSYDAPDHIWHWNTEAHLRQDIIPAYVTGRSVSVNDVVSKPEDYAMKQRAFVVRIEV